MLADGDKIILLGAPPIAYGLVSTSTTILNTSGASQLFYAVVVAGHALASVNANGGGLSPADLGPVYLADEGTRWVRGWDREARDALLAANKLTESVDAAE